MNISELCIRRPVFATVLSLMLVLFGLVALERLSVREYPDIARPVVSVVAPALETGVIVGRSENIAAQASFARSVTVPASRRSELQPGLALGSLSLGTRIAGGESPAEGSLPAQFDWLSSLEIAPMQRMQLEGFRFEARPTEAATNSVYGGRPRPTQQGVVEMTAFQMTK